MTNQPALIDRLLSSAQSRYSPDIKGWNPERQVESHMRIATDGRWFHMGTEIKRQEMTALFAALLRCEGDEYFLVTPVEKAIIEVEDTPFRVVDFEADEKGRAMRIIVQTNLGEWTPIDSPDQLFMRPLPEEKGTCPCADIRDGLVGRFTRAAHFRLGEVLVKREGWFGVWSYGRYYSLQRDPSCSAQQA